MSKNINRIFVVGFPSLYGGAGTELHHQIIIWVLMKKEVHIIPLHEFYKYDSLYSEMLKWGVIIHEPEDWHVLNQGDPVFGFCDLIFLNKLPKIREYTKRTIFVNCMTFLFDKEKEMMSRGMIAMFLYQNDEVREKCMNELKSINNDDRIIYKTFKPYFHKLYFPFVNMRCDDSFCCGHISRSDPNKFNANILKIYDEFICELPKKGVFLGFNDACKEKIGEPFEWIILAKDHNDMSSQDFYGKCKIVLQPSDTIENWPRIGLEAMSSGSVLIVDNRGGWKQMIEHGENGWLCNSDRDFIQYANIMASDVARLKDMSLAAQVRVEKIAGLNVSIESWEEVFEIISRLPE